MSSPPKVSEGEISLDSVTSGVSGYPNRQEEIEIMRRRMDRMKEEILVDPVTGIEEILQLQQTVEHIHVDDDVLGYIADIVQATRSRKQVEVGVSPRGSLALFKLSRARAVLQGRDFVLPDDVKDAVEPALAHRMIMKTESWAQGASPNQVIDEVVKNIPVPRLKA